MTTIKALSIWQPWASLILLGQKHFETRSWFTDYRGELVIHASKKKGDRLQKWQQLVLEEKYGIELDLDSLPYGKAIAVCDLVDCIPMTLDFIDRQIELELDCGDWQPGRWAWKIENVRAIDPSIPLRGRQGLFNFSLNK